MLNLITHRSTKSVLMIITGMWLMELVEYQTLEQQAQV